MSRKTEIRDSRILAMRCGYFQDQVLKNMAIIEKLETAKSGRPVLFHEIHKELEKTFWEYHQAADLSGLTKIHNRLCKMVDELRGEVGVS